MSRCGKRREGDEFTCPGCGMRWGINEADPAVCNATGEPKGWKALPPVPMASVSPVDDGKPYVCGPVPVYTGEERRRKLREALDSLAKSPGAKWKERK